MPVKSIGGGDPPYKAPIVESVLTFLAAHVDRATIGERISEDNVIEDITRVVSALLYTTRSNPAFQAFASMVSDS